jgi:hypothetical protein
VAGHAVAWPLGFNRTFETRHKWLSDSHIGRAMAYATSSWDTSLWLGHWSITQPYESYTAVHIVKLRLCRLRWNVQARRRSVCDVRATSVVPNHFSVCGCNNSVSSTQWSVWKHPKMSAICLHRVIITDV